MKAKFVKAIVFLLGLTIGVGASDLVEAAPSFLLITAVDDTIKVSHMADGLSKVVSPLTEPVSVTGMSVLYSSMIDEAKGRSQAAKFVVLSGAPQLFGSSLWNFLEASKFPEPHRVIEHPTLISAEDYKRDAITTVLTEPDNASATVILVGDDTETDLEAYQNSLNATAIGAKKFARESQIYIRRVSGGATTLARSVRNAVAFDSAADIAISEFAQGRLSRAAVERVFTEVETETDSQRLFVPDRQCPSVRDIPFSRSLRVDTIPVDLLNRFVRLEAHLRKTCSSLKAWISQTGE